MTWATSVPILVFLSLSVLDLGPMYATDRQTSDVGRASSLNALPWGGGSCSCFIIFFLEESGWLWDTLAAPGYAPEMNSFFSELIRTL